MYEFNSSKTKVRNTILKTMLEGSEQGKKFLDLLTSLKIKIGTKMMTDVPKKSLRA
jgi:hypothetical protein